MGIILSMQVCLHFVFFFRPKVNREWAESEGGDEKQDKKEFKTK